MLAYRLREPLRELLIGKVCLQSQAVMIGSGCVGDHSRGLMSVIQCLLLSPRTLLLLRAALRPCRHDDL